MSRFITRRSDEAINCFLNVLSSVWVTNWQHDQCAHQRTQRVRYLQARQPLRQITRASGKRELETRHP